jgi:site-specific DNA recombinase
LTGAPFGYRYVSRNQGGGMARFEVVEAEAHIVRLIFSWIGMDRMSLREVCRRLRQMGCQTRKGASYWYASTIRSMLDNPAYIGRATFGRSRFLPPRPRLRPIRGHIKPSLRATSRVAVPPEEWIEIPVPSLVDPTVFELARTQLEENRRRKRRQKTGASWLLQGLTVCRRCGYAYYGKAAPRSRKYDPTNILRYYRCTGADGYRFSGAAVCDNGPVRSDQLEQVVWDQVKALLEQPDRVAHEYRRRIAQARDGAAAPDEILHLDRQISSVRRGIGRLIDSYAEGVIDKAEFEPRITGLKQRMSQLEERHEAALEAAAAERDLSLVISRLEDFSARVTGGLEALDERGRQEIVRALVRRIEIDNPGIEVIFRVPSLDGPAGPPTLTKTNASWHHCSGVRRTDVRLDQPSPTPGQGFRGNHRVRARVAAHRPRVPAHATPRKALRFGNVEVAQPLQTLVDIEKPRLAAHRFVSRSANASESGAAENREVLRSVQLSSPRRLFARRGAHALVLRRQRRPIILPIGSFGRR